MRSAKTELQSTIELRATASEIAAPKPDLDAKVKKNRFWSTLYNKKRKENHQRQNWENLLTNHYRSLDAATLIRFTMSSAKDNSITHAAAAPINLDAAITLRSAEAELQNTLAARTTRKNVSKMMSELSVPLRGRSENDPGTNECVPQPPAGQISPSICQDTFCPAKPSISCIRSLSQKRSKTHFVRDRPQKLKAEDVKTKLSYETSLKTWKWKMWKRSFRAKPPSKSESGRCENEAFVRDLPENMKVEDVKTKLSFSDRPQNLKVEDVKTKLSCMTSFEFWKFKLWKWSLNCQILWL